MLQAGAKNLRNIGNIHYLKLEASLIRDEK